MTVSGTMPTEIYSCFTEWLDAGDLKDAKVLLDELDREPR
jgi:hypothetical protein